MGNLWSIQNAVHYLGHDSMVSAEPEEIENSDFLILPGVGSFRKAMNTLTETGLAQAILNAVQKRGTKILGICLGMQLLGISSTEDGMTEGLKLVSLPVEKFSTEELRTSKIPHIGFNAVQLAEQSGLFARLPSVADFYFVHSYKMPLAPGLDANIGVCNYEAPFLAAFHAGNICGTQFHPEKSQMNGLILMRNFIEG